MNMYSLDGIGPGSWEWVGSSVNKKSRRRIMSHTCLIATLIKIPSLGTKWLLLLLLLLLYLLNLIKQLLMALAIARPPYFPGAGTISST